MLNVLQANFIPNNNVFCFLQAIGNTILAATDKGKLWFYDINGDLLHVLDVTCMPITSLCISKSEENCDLIYIGSLDTTLRICNFQAKQIMKAVQVDEKIQCMEISWGYCFLGSDRGYLVRYNILVMQIIFIYFLFGIKILFLFLF